MVVIGLGCVVALAIGLRAGLQTPVRATLSARQQVRQQPWQRKFRWTSLILLYVLATALVTTVQRFAWLIPGLTQGILALTYLRLVILLLIFRRLCQPRVRWAVISLLLAFEVLLGMTSYFAGFREPLLLATMAVLEAYHYRKRYNWITLGALIAVMAFLGMLWLGVRGSYRNEFYSEELRESRTARVERIGQLSSEWAGRGLDQLSTSMDDLVSRLWGVYYPALAVARVPMILPHEGGAILWRAVEHILTPRLLFPSEDGLPSDSEMVRRYSGVWVAGPESGTSIAFGYAAESYVDFGIPWMFLPVAAYGALMGVAYRWTSGVIRNRELAAGTVTVVFWLSLYLFERSWVMTLGLSMTLLIYLGGFVVLLDRCLVLNRRPRPLARVRAR
jgi:hypothetical protein